MKPTKKSKIIFQAERFASEVPVEDIAKSVYGREADIGELEYVKTVLRGAKINFFTRREAFTDDYQADTDSSSAEAERIKDIIRYAYKRTNTMLDHEYASQGEAAAVLDKHIKNAEKELETSMRLGLFMEGRGDEDGVRYYIDDALEEHYDLMEAPDHVPNPNYVEAFEDALHYLRSGGTVFPEGGNSYTVTANECSLIAYHVFAKSTLGQRHGSIEQSEFDKVVNVLSEEGWRINMDVTSETVHDANSAKATEILNEFLRYVDTVWGDLQDSVLQRHNSAAKPGSTWIHATRGDFPRLLEQVDEFPVLQYDDDVREIVKAIDYISSGLRKFEPVSTVVDELEGIVNALTRELANGVENDMFDLEEIRKDLDHYSMLLELMDPLSLWSRIRTLRDDARQALNNAK